MVKNILRLIHSFIIGFICSRIASGYHIDPIIVGAEIGLTLLRAVVEHGLFSRNTRFQILASMVLGYTLFPNKARYISWVFFLKGIEAHKATKNVRQQASILNGKQIGKYLAFVFDVIRFSLSQFIFFGFVCSVYKFFLDTRSDPIPDPHVIIYQLVVTASTIGYGDITPKSRSQMIFFTYAVPLLCSSFVIYVNSLVEVYTNTFLAEEEQVPVQVQDKQKEE